MFFQDAGSSRPWQWNMLACQRAKVIHCSRSRLFTKGNWPQYNGVCSRGRYCYPIDPVLYTVLTFQQCFDVVFNIHFQNHNGVSAKCRNAKVEDLWSLTSFFGFSTQTFVLAVNLLDRFLAIMKVCILNIFVLWCGHTEYWIFYIIGIFDEFF